MAFPSTISSLIEPWHSIGGPFVSSTGNVYVLARSSGGGDLHMFKASDPSTSWSGAGSDPSTTNTIRHLAACQVSDVIHVVTRDASTASNNQIRYHAFNMASDTWTTTNELVKTTYTCASAVDDSAVDIVIRGDGTKIVFYEGPQVLADIQRSRTYYARYMGAAWSADIAVDNGGNAHWMPQQAVLGSADRVHFFLMDKTNGDYYQRCLTSANALESFPSAFDSAVHPDGDVGLHRAVAYSASAGGTVVRAPYFDSYTPEFNDVRFSSADAPSPLTVTTDITGATVPYTAQRRVVGFAKDDPTIYAVFANDSQDIYIMSSQDAGSWSTPALFYTGTTETIFTNAYVRNNNRVVGIVFRENGTDMKYTEYTVSAIAAAGTTILPRMGLMGVGR